MQESEVNLIQVAQMQLNEVIRKELETRNEMARVLDSEKKTLTQINKEQKRLKQQPLTEKQYEEMKEKRDKRKAELEILLYNAKLNRQRYEKVQTHILEKYFPYPDGERPKEIE